MIVVEITWWDRAVSLLAHEIDKYVGTEVSAYDCVLKNGVCQKQAHGPVAQSWFSTIFLSNGKSTDMHKSASGLGVQHGRRWVWTIIWVVSQCTSSLSGFVNRRLNRKWRFSLNNKQRKKGSKRIQMIIKMLTEFKRTPNPDAGLSMFSLFHLLGLQNYGFVP